MTGVQAEGDVGVHGSGPIGVRGESTTGSGVYGETDSPGHTQAGVHGVSTNLAPGILGEAAASTGVRGIGGAGEYGGSFSGGTGVYGRSVTGLGDGVYGESERRYGLRGQSTESHGVYGTTAATSGHGVHGEAAGSAASGVYGTSSGQFGSGVAGYGTGSSGQGVYGNGSAVGVFGATDAGSGLFGFSRLGRGVFGRSIVTGTAGSATGLTGATYGVYGENVSTAGGGVYGRASATSGLVAGVAGETRSPGGSGVFGLGPAIGIAGASTSPNGAAVYGLGHVKQTVEGNGLVKGAAYIECDASPRLLRGFNNVNAVPVTVGLGGAANRCRVDFGFDVSARFWTVSVDSADLSVMSACYRVGPTNSVLECGGARDNMGALAMNLMILVY
jgi:hypothetical protein